MGGGASFPITRLSKDRIIVVTGASGGLGYEIAKWCAMMGATVIMACRSEQRSRQAIERMNEEFKTEKAKGTADLTESDTLTLEFMQVDCASFKSVVNFTNEFKKSGRKLHVLFLNAGMGFAPYSKTEDGLEMVLQVNYLSQFLMTAKLLPIMKQSGDDCRILLMTSLVHVMAEFDLGTMNYTGAPEDFNQSQYYSRSKLYQIMQMFSMVKRLQSTTITVNSLHPGVVYSNFGSERSGLWKWLMPCLRCCMGKSPKQASVRPIDCATNPKRACITGQYFNENKLKTPSAISRMPRAIVFTKWSFYFGWLKNDRVLGDCTQLQLCNDNYTDGEYWLYPDAFNNEPVKIYCHNLTTADPGEYITVDPDVNHSYNRAQYPENNSRYNFTKIGISIGTNVSVIANDFSFILRSGPFISSLEYGIAMSCAWAWGAEGQFSINTTITGLIVDPSLEWKLMGVKSAFHGFVRSSDGDAISSNCGGHCGECRPKKEMTLHINPTHVMDHSKATVPSCKQA